MVLKLCQCLSHSDIITCSTVLHELSHGLEALPVLEPVRHHYLQYSVTCSAFALTFYTSLMNNFIFNFIHHKSGSKNTKNKQNKHNKTNNQSIPTETQWSTIYQNVSAKSKVAELYEAKNLVFNLLNQTRRRCSL